MVTRRDLLKQLGAVLGVLRSRLPQRTPLPSRYGYGQLGYGTNGYGALTRNRAPPRTTEETRAPTGRDTVGRPTSIRDRIAESIASVRERVDEIQERARDLLRDLFDDEDDE